MPISSKKSVTVSHTTSACNMLCGVVAFLLLLTSLAAMMGVVNTHRSAAGFVFGGTSASLALIAFAINFTLCCKMLCLACHGSNK